jgi:hypothetical protein
MNYQWVLVPGEKLHHFLLPEGRSCPVHHVRQRFIPLPGRLSPAGQEAEDPGPELAAVLVQNLPVPLVHAVKVPDVLKDDEKIFPRPAAGQLDEVGKVTACRRGLVFNAQRPQEVGQLAEAGSGAGKQEDVGRRGAVAAAPSTPHLEVVWTAPQLQERPVAGGGTKIPRPRIQVCSTSGLSTTVVADVNYRYCSLYYTALFDRIFQLDFFFNKVLSTAFGLYGGQRQQMVNIFLNSTGKHLCKFKRQSPRIF